jgi:hypothetical protein
MGYGKQMFLLWVSINKLMEFTSVHSMRKNYQVERAFFRIKMVTSTKETGKMVFNMAGALLKTTPAFMRVFGRMETKLKEHLSTKKGTFMLALF